MPDLPGILSNSDARILLVEDDPDDVVIIQRIIRQAPISVHVETRANGQEALTYLETCQDKDGHPLPDLILLDLNMPVMDGSGFIREVRRNSHLSALPICVFTTSKDDDVINSAYEDGANAVVSKVDSLDGMSQILNTIVDFWFRTAKRYYIE